MTQVLSARGCGVAAVVGVVALVILMFIGTHNIEAGHVGVVTNFGAPQSDVWGAGWHWKVPFQQNVVDVNVQTQAHVFQEAQAASKENQKVFVDGKVNYFIDQNKVVGLYTKVGLDFANKVFDPAFQDYLRAEVPRYEAADIQSHQDEIRTSVRDRLKATAAAYGVDVLDVFLTKIHFDPDYEKAIAAKAVSLQQQQQADIQRQTTVINADAAAQAQIKSAEADAKANALRSQNLSAELVQYLAVQVQLQAVQVQAQAVQKWDGKLPGVTGSVPFISVSPIGPQK